MLGFRRKFSTYFNIC
ncbi:hypothetical protein MXB_5432 [Myxobolus squamalis]|nr:hypothetical protein MXB_5432 [Myxobolus squamalis]